MAACAGPRGPASPRPRPAGSTSATWRTRCSCGGSRGPPERRSRSGSRITIARAADRSTTRGSSRTSPGWASSPTRPAPPTGRRRALHGRARSTPRRHPGLRLRLLADDIRGMGRRARPALAWSGLPRRVPTPRPDGPTAARRARRRLGALDGRIVGPCATRWRPAATRRSATATGTGHTSCRSSSTTSARVDLVVRGRDLLAATPDQIRLGRLLGREAPPTFAHHPLVRHADGRSCRRPTATRRCGTCGRPGAHRPCSSATRHWRSG